jgi:hypothetical protein
MAYFPIVPKTDRTTERLIRRQLPAFYMEDYSVLGLRVNDCGRAVRIMERHAFSIRRVAGGVDVDIAGASRMHELIQLLEGNGLDCEIADIAVEIYQG